MPPRGIARTSRAGYPAVGQIVTLKEDLGGGTDAQADITALLLPTDNEATAVIITREKGVFCGQRWLEEVFSQLGGGVTIEWQVADSDHIEVNQPLCRLSGSARILLTGERTVLNFVQTLCCVASEVKRYVDALEVSGNVTLETLRDCVLTGVDYISVGALTKHLRALDLSMRFHQR